MRKEKRDAPEVGRVVILSLTSDGEAKLAAVHDALGAERAQLRRVIDELEDAEPS